jgi:hypothetical protein
MLACPQHLLSGYPYYMLWEEENKVSSCLVRYAERTGEYDVGEWKQHRSVLLALWCCWLMWPVCHSMVTRWAALRL